MTDSAPHHKGRGAPEKQEQQTNIAIHGENPIVIPEDIATKCDGPDQFENFDRGVRLFLSVPKSAVLKDEAKTKRRKERAKETFIQK